MEDMEVLKLIRKERQIARSTIQVIWGFSLCSILTVLFLSGWQWVWVWLIAVPVIINALIVNRAYYRIASETGISTAQVHAYWRGLQKHEPYGE